MNKIGIMLNNLERDRIEAWKVVSQAGFSIVHTNAIAEAWLSGEKKFEYIHAARSSGLTIDTMFIGFDGQDYSDIESITRTVGLLAIPDLRQHRLQVALKYTDLASELGVSQLAMHLGFMPTDPTHPDYQFLVSSVQQILAVCQKKGQTLHLETGQESAEELLRFIEVVNRPNLGVNFDPGNFLLYGTDEPVPAFSLLSKYVRGFHCKDGLKKDTPGKLGMEKPLGQGQVDFSTLLKNLKSIHFTGPLIIEREIGPNVLAEVQAGRQYLQSMLENLQ